MSQLFARIELRGNPSLEVYQRLHDYMESLNWLRTISGTKTTGLPHATYQATFTAPSPDLLKMATDFRTEIEAKIWTKTVVLIIQSSNWAQSGIV
jgi:hypothetical protein